MIYITGDTHGDIDFKKLEVYFSKKYVTYKDYLIILGDCGIVWSESDCHISDYSRFRLTVLFIDGNHENFELLNKFPVVDYHGAKCHRLAGNVYHILRGEIITLNNTKFFCIGGATSIDKKIRTNRISWWEEENISSKDIENGLTNLEKVDYKVDYVLTHCAPSKIVKKMFLYETDNNTDILEKCQEKINFKYWYFGHYHENKKYDRYRCFYGDILEIPIMDEGKKIIKYFSLYSKDDGNLYNLKTGRRISLKEEDLPEWYYFGYSKYIFSLKDVTDTAFHRSYSDNHLNKDAAIYLHYHGKLRKQKNYEPLENERWNVWDASSWRDSCKEICLGIEKYSPNLDLRKLKAAINLNYDQYNNRSEFIAFDREDIVVRPFPEVDTPHYVSRYGDKRANYMVRHGKAILTEFIEEKAAIKYAECYLNKYLNISLLRQTIGDDKCDYVYAYDTGHIVSNWVYIKRIKYE